MGSSVLGRFIPELSPLKYIPDDVKELLSSIKALAERNHEAHGKTMQDWLGQVTALTNDLKDLVDDHSPQPVGQRKNIFPKLFPSDRQQPNFDDIKKRLENFKKLAEDEESKNEKSKSTSTNDSHQRYHELEPVQKLCVTYCSLFPKGYVIDVQRLINLWMAEKFLITDDDGSASDLESVGLESVGREYVNRLGEKKMGLFQDVEIDECDNVISWRMVPEMHDLASSFHSATKENVLLMDPDGDKVNNEHRRVSFGYSLDASCGIPDSLFDKAKKLWTILLPGATPSSSRLPNEVKLSISTCEQIFSTFKRLHVLDLHDLGIKMVPSSISELKYLRYLDLSENDFDRLPSSITKLSLLQTLKLSHCYALKELPKDLHELSKLRHLELEGCLNLTQMPPRLKEMSSLCTLSHFVASDSNRGLDQLAELNNLTGDLEILHLERVKSGNPGVLKNKLHLRRLTLRWDHDRDKDEKNKSSQQVLDSAQCLEPPKDLKVLFILGYKDEVLPGWLSDKSLQSSLIKFSLYNCPSCKCVPSLHKLLSLKILKLQRLDSLESITENSGGGSSSNDVNGSKVLPSLKELTISDCPKLQSWWDQKTDDRETFPCISKLEIQYCPMLTSMPLFPNLDQKLVLESSSVKPLLNTLSRQQSPPPLSKLKCMLIANLQQDSSSAEECNRLESLPQDFKVMTSLEHLNTQNCAELYLFSDGWKGLEELHHLTIIQLPNLLSLPPKLEHITALKHLAIRNCPELTSLLEGIDKLASLETLEISECNKLASLPKGMKELKHLQTLIIRDCPLLLPRCQPETGDDWPQIKHIKNKLVN